MKVRFIALIALGMVVGGAANGQDAGNPPPGGRPSEPGGAMGRGVGGRGWGGMMGRGVIGTVTNVGSDLYTIKSELGDIYTIHFNANTRILKQPPQRTGEEGMRTPPQAIKSGDVKVGEVIAANGEVDTEAKSVGAVVVMLIDPERARQMREMEANFGKTWLAGRVTALNETKITLESPMDHAAHSFTADENTSFHKRREPVTLADIQVGDMVRVEGSIKDGVFMATQVGVMGPPVSGGPVPHPGPPPQ